MALIDIADLADDPDFRARAIAAAALEGDPNPGAWADTRMWAVAAEPGLADAYASALVNGVERPGLDPAVIGDGQLVAAVAAVAGVGS